MVAQMTSQEWLRYQGCNRKYPFHDEKSAKKAARDLERKTGYKFNVYTCTYCGCWHTGKDKGNYVNQQR